MELDQILFFNEIKFVCDLFDKICQKEHIKSYSSSVLEDFSYLIDDLKPQIIVIEGKTYSSWKADFINYLEQAKLKPMVILMSESDVYDADSVINVRISGQFNPKTIINELRNALGSAGKKN
jgi:hypothetical protein